MKIKEIISNRIRSKNKKLSEINKLEYFYVGSYNDLINLTDGVSFDHELTRPPFDKIFIEISNSESNIESIGYSVCIKEKKINDVFELEFNQIGLRDGILHYNNNTLSVLSTVDSNNKLRAIGRNDNIDKVSDDHVRIMLETVSPILQLLKVISCSNVEIVNNIKYKKKSNGRKGKGLMLYSYKTLHIKPSKTITRNTSDAIGTHSSPRLHLRRGHIRKLSTGLTVWVQSCMVGTQDNGIVEKDYVVTV